MVQLNPPGGRCDVHHTGPRADGILVLPGVTVAAAGGPGASPVGELVTTQIAGVTVLTDANGFTL